jgi:hypothetical protein
VSYENVAVPFIKFNNRQVLLETQLYEMPELRDFMECFSSCFEYDPARCLWVFYPEGDAPSRKIMDADVVPFVAPDEDCG